MNLFHQIHEAVFLKRINRFLISVHYNNKTEFVHLPNPGRLRELLLPGNKVLIEKNPVSKERKTQFTLAGAFRENIPIMLHTHFSNKFTDFFIRNTKLPFLPPPLKITPEVKYNNSRFDFCIHSDSMKIMLEVKSCTLFKNKTAMFPDAVSLRATKHLLHLHDFSKNKNSKAVILFIVHWLHADYFLPDFHTDLLFAKTLYQYRNSIEYYPVAIEWDNQLNWTGRWKLLNIPWKTIEKNLNDSGIFIVVFHISNDLSINSIDTKTIFIKNGYYVYVSTKQEQLTKAITKFKKIQRKPQNEIELIRNSSALMEIIPIRGSLDISNDLTNNLQHFSQWSIQMNQQNTTIYGFQNNPNHLQEFQEMVLDYQMSKIFHSFE